jgi:hypothetical protein
MPNERVVFITGEEGRGSSLYMVTANWVLRCSGHHDRQGPIGERRRATTFIRRRGIVYMSGLNRGNRAEVGYTPIEQDNPHDDTHIGHPITCIVARGEELAWPRREPYEWNDRNGVSWEVACREIDEAAEYARTTQRQRASRDVKSGDDFGPD